MRVSDLESATATPRFGSVHVLISDRLPQEPIPGNSPLSLTEVLRVSVVPLPPLAKAPPLHWLILASPDIESVHLLVHFLQPLLDPVLLLLDLLIVASHLVQLVLQSLDVERVLSSLPRVSLVQICQSLDLTQNLLLKIFQFPLHLTDLDSFFIDTIPESAYLTSENTLVKAIAFAPEF